MIKFKMNISNCSYSFKMSPCWDVIETGTVAPLFGDYNAAGNA